MTTLCHRLVLLLLLAASSAALAESSIMALRKKLQGLKEASAKSCTQEMNAALQRGDVEKADKALKAAIAQGTLTQAQIDEARGRVAAVVSQQLSAMVAAARAKEEASRQSASSGSLTTSEGQSSGAASARMCQIKVEGGEWFSSVRLFNVDASGNEVGQSDASPGRCTDAHKSAGENDWTNHHTVIISAGDKGLAGTYGYEIKYVEVTSRGLSNNETGRRKTFRGTFTIPAVVAMAR